MAVRESWRLGTEPIIDLTEVLEDIGLKVLLSAHARARDFDGLAAEADGHTVILVGSQLPGDRQRFTMAHELGHLILAGRLNGALARRRGARLPSLCRGLSGARTRSLEGPWQVTDVAGAA